MRYRILAQCINEYSNYYNYIVQGQDDSVDPDYWFSYDTADSYKAAEKIITDLQQKES